MFILTTYSYIHHDDVEFARKSARSLATTGKQSLNKQATVIYPENLLHLQQIGLCVKYIGEVQKISIRLHDLPSHNSFFA